MNKATIMLAATALVLVLAGAFVFPPVKTLANVSATVNLEPQPEPTVVTRGGFEVEVLVNGRSIEEYAARGRHYVEAL